MAHFWFYNNKVMNRIQQNIAKISVVVLVTVLSAFTYQTDIFDSVATAIRANNAKDVASYFNSSIDFSVEGREGVYSKTQAEMILKNFFTQHPCTKFDITHRAKSYGSSSFAIGAYASASGNYRVTVYVKEISGKSLIHEMKIESGE